MDKSLRIIFYGTPEFATGVLQTLHESQHQVIAVVTAADKPAGRGQKLNQSHVKQYALSQNIPVLQPTNLKSTAFIAQLNELNADLQVIVAFRMLPEVVWSMPPLGTFNLHASLLPAYRGAAPINWAIINREQHTGVTTFFIDHKIDTGAIIDQTSCDIDDRETAGSLYYKLLKMGQTLSLQTVNYIAQGGITIHNQPKDTNHREAPKLNANNTTINWQQSAQSIDALVRGLHPYPIAKALLQQNDTIDIIKIYQTSIDLTDHNLQPGTIIIKDNVIKVACNNGYIIIDEIQLPNKKRMDSKSLLNGYKFTTNARFINTMS